jgi:hypothetical protein
LFSQRIKENPMNDKKGQRKGILNRALREPLAVILVLALLTPGLAAKERRGAEVVLVLRNDTVIQGELLAVKGTDLILLRGSTSAEATESLVNIQSVDRVAKRSKWLTGMVIGAITGAVIGEAATPMHPDPNADDVSLTKGEAALIGALGYGLVGAAIGGVIKEKAVKIEKTDPEYLAGIAAKLKTWARDPH